MRMSNRHTSGRSRRASSTARRPSAASPTTSMSGWASRIIASPVRTISWSSATSTRMLTSADPGPGQHGGHGPAAIGVRAGLAGAAEQVGALDHADEAVPGDAAGRMRAGVAVVAHPQAHRGVVGGDADLDAGGVPRVPPGVGDRLLGEAVDRGPDRRAAGRRGRRRSPRRRPGRSAVRLGELFEVGDARGRAPGRPAGRGAGRGPWRASRRARATPRPRSRAAPRSRRPVATPRSRGRPGRGSPSPRRGGRRCRAGRGPAARVRAA